MSGGFEIDDPLARAEIEILAVDRGVEVAGLDGETVTLAKGQGMTLPARTPARPTPVIVRPHPLPPGGIRALLIPGKELEPLTEVDLESLGKDAPIVFSVAFAHADAEQVDLRQLRAVAAQAADLNRRLVIAASDTLDG